MAQQEYPKCVMDKVTSLVIKTQKLSDMNREFDLYESVAHLFDYVICGEGCILLSHKVFKNTVINKIIEFCGHICGFRRLMKRETRHILCDELQHYKNTKYIIEMLREVDILMAY